MAKTGIALIGAGMVSGTYAAALRTLSETVSLAGVLARRESSAQEFIRQHGFQFATVYSTLAELAQDASVDVVIVTTPPNARLEIIQALAKAGKAILMEKPLERDLPAAQQLCDLCKQHSTPFGVVLQHRVRPSARQLDRILAEQQAGDLRAVEISVPWWRPQSYYNEPGRGTYERDGGGVLINQAIHTLDLALQYTGQVQSVVALSATTGFHRMESEDFVSAGIRFANGAVGNVFASTSCFPGRSESIRLYFENVSVRLESSLLELHWHDGRVEAHGDTGASGAGADPMAFTADWHTTVIDEFCQAVRNKQPVPLPANSALSVHALIAAIEKSANPGLESSL